MNVELSVTYSGSIRNNVITIAQLFDASNSASQTRLTSQELAVPTTRLDQKVLLFI